MTTQQTTGQRASILWVIVAAFVTLGAYIQIYLLQRNHLNVMDIYAMSVAAIIVVAGVMRSRIWSGDPLSQANHVWTSESFLLSLLTLYFYLNDQTLATFATLSGLAYQLVFRDFCAGIVRRWEGAQQVEFQNRMMAMIEGSQKQASKVAEETLPQIRDIFRELAQPLTDEPVKLAQAVQESVNEWRSILLSSAQDLSAKLENTSEEITFNVKNNLTQVLTEIQSNLGQATAEVADQAVRTWLNGAQKASEAWTRATDTGVRCLTDQIQVVAKQWEEQFKMSRSWLEELQKLLVQIRSISNSWEDQNDSKLAGQQNLGVAVDQLAEQLKGFQAEFDRIVTQLTHDQKEWTLGLLNQRRYLQIDQ